MAAGGLGRRGRFTDAVGAWLSHLDASGLSAATIGAYHRDVAGIAARVSAADDPRALRLPDLTKGALRAAFESWAGDHATASVLRAHSAWSSFFDFLVIEDVLDGNPMAVVPKPKRSLSPPRAIGDPDAAARLLATAAVPDARSRAPWPERDLALVATFCVTGIRAGEAVSLDTASLTGARGPGRRLAVAGTGGRARSIRVDEPLEAALADYLDSRSARFPDHALDDPAAPLFVDSRGLRLSADQVKYLIERLYVRAGLRARVPSGALVHALRHTFAVSAVKAGADLLELQALLGHASLDATRRYLDATCDSRTVPASHPGQVHAAPHGPVARS